MNDYMIEDGHGNEITRGLDAYSARQAAQRAANRRGDTVYLWSPGATEPEAFEPEQDDDREYDDPNRGGRLPQT